MKPKRACGLMIGSMLWIACGGESTGGIEPFHIEPEAAKADDKAVAEIKAKAQSEVDAVRRAEIDKYATLPARAATDLEHACADAAKAADEWMQKRLPDDKEMLERWNEGKQTELASFEQACREIGSIDVALCEAHALRTAPLVFEQDESTLFVERCKQKYAK